jgi:hypothetical protein
MAEEIRKQSCFDAVAVPQLLLNTMLWAPSSTQTLAGSTQASCSSLSKTLEYFKKQGSRNLGA